MSKLPGNPYVEEMKRAVDERPEAWISHGDMATLALAYEQRTASLIALVESEAFNFSFSASQADVIAQQVMVRLGVGRPMGEGADLDEIADTGTYTPPTEPPVHPSQVPVQTDRKYTPTETYIRACLMAQLDWEREDDGKSWTPERGQEIVAEADRLIARVKAEALLSEESVERAMLGIHASHDRGDWDEELPVVQAEYRDMARAALTAALGEDESNE